MPVHHDNTQLLVFTDLDGTLLDHYTYSAKPALEALNVLKAHGIPVIFNTSKTAVECQAISASLGLCDPFVVENGSAIYYPKHHFDRQTLTKGNSTTPPVLEGVSNYWRVVLGAPLHQIHKVLTPLNSQFSFLTLSESSLADICAITGLSMEQAAKARNREFSEPILWQDSAAALTQFRDVLTAAGLTLLKGGRFYHVLGQSDKGHALSIAAGHYAARSDATPARPLTIALGDSDNDLAMLAAADLPVLISSPAHPPPPHDTINNLTISTRVGPAGWAECIFAILEKYHADSRGQ